MFYIYMFKNTINSKIYIGKSKNCKTTRYTKHLSAAKSNDPKRITAIHRAINKYGIENFNFEIIDKYNSEQDCYEAEKSWILFLNSNNPDYGYNLSLGGFGGISPTESTKEKVKKYWENNPELKQKYSDKMKQKHIDDPTYFSRIGKNATGMLGKHHTDEAKKSMSEKRQGSKQANSKLSEKDILDIRNKYIPGKYSSCKLAKEYNVKKSTILSILNNKTWKHVEQPDLLNKLSAKDFKHGVNAKLTDQQVSEIREKYIPQIYTTTKLAKEYNINRNTILRIVNNISYRDELYIPKFKDKTSIKLSKEQVEDIKNKYIPRKYSMYKLAKEYNVTYSTIENAINNR